MINTLRTMLSKCEGDSMRLRVVGDFITLLIIEGVLTSEGLIELYSKEV